MAAPLFPVNAHRYDPYRTFMFQVVIDGKPVAGLRKMGALKKTTEAVKWRTAGDPAHERVMPGGTSYEPVTLEQGLTHDPVFENWANLVNNIQGSAAMSLVKFRKAVAITPERTAPRTVQTVPQRMAVRYPVTPLPTRVAMALETSLAPLANANASSSTKATIETSMDSSYPLDAGPATTPPQEEPAPAVQP